VSANLSRRALFAAGTATTAGLRESVRRRSVAITSAVYHLRTGDVLRLA
jgi:hypothetical protein